MPSFLTDDNSPIFSNSTHVLDLDPTKFGLPAATKTTPNGANAATTDESRANTSTTTDASFDDTYDYESTAHSDVTDATPLPAKGDGVGRDDRQPDVNGTRLASMNSIPNGRPADGGEKVEEKPAQNGTTMSLADRTAMTRPTKDIITTSSSPTDPAYGRTSMGSIQQSPLEYYQRPSKSGSASPVDGLNVVSSNKAPTSLVTPASPLPNTDMRTNSPHRFSSPPQYNAGASSSTTLQPATPGQLRQRHTLEVPKVPPGRGSKDGVDGAFTTGRFSPTSTTAPRRASLSLGRRNTRSMQSDLPRDEVVPDEDAKRWAEAYRQKRATKKRRREEEDDDRVLVGTKVDEHHVNWVTAYNMLTGIRVSVSRTNAKLDRELTDADFEAKQKSTFDIAGNELVPSAKYDFKFKDYAPWVFRRLRTLFRLDPADYLMSLTGKYILSELGSPGKSGSFFYFSRDYKYIIKTIHHAEHKFLRKVLKEYYQHVADNPNTLLSQFYGLHRVKMPYGKKIHFVVMNNLFPPHRDIHQTFDLKGSTVGRDYREDDLANNPRATLKDLNWMRRQRHLELGIQKKRLFLDQLQRDVQLLKRLEIMDYSLLIGIHDLRKGNEENLRDKTLRVFNPGGDEPAPEEPDISVLLRTPSKLENARKAKELRQMLRQEKPVPMGQTASRMPDELEEGRRSGFVFNQDDGGFRATHEDNTPADEVYYLGVIDCLTHYGVIKKIEHFWKGLSSDRTQISALPPVEYGERFFRFIEGVTMTPEEAEREAEAERLAAAEHTAVSDGEGRLSSWSSGRRRSTTMPGPPNRSPPAVPTARSPEARATVERASTEARKSEDKEDEVPSRTITAVKTDKLGKDQQILPVVEESGETSSTGERSQTDERPPTPMKDVTPVNGAPGKDKHTQDFRPITPMKTSPRRSGEQGPPTPPKYLKPESADSGYGGNGGSGSREGSLRLTRRISRESLNKELPPLPKDGAVVAGSG